MKNYDPSQIVIAFRGLTVQGFADGTFVKVSRNADTFSAKIGANGDTTRVRNRDRTGKVVVTLQAESPSNDDFSAAALLDETTGLGTGPLLVKNLNGTTIYEAQVAWVGKPADGEYAKDATTREWTLECEVLRMYSGGAIL